MNMSQASQPIANRAREVSTLGGGCFWCTEAVFDNLKGVLSVESGYSGGKVNNPSYREICTGNTGHAEVVQVTFDPNVLPYEKLLEVFFAVHDPTTLNRQGADEGTQYRSVILYHSPEHKAIAEQVVKELTDGKAFKSRIVTEISPFTTFFIAEDYHQEYYQMNGEQPYCRYVIDPKMKKFRERYRDWLKT